AAKVYVVRLHHRRAELSRRASPSLISAPKHPKEAHPMDRLVNGQILLAGLYCALALNAVTAWVRFARPPEEPDAPTRAMGWQTISAVLQTLALPLVYAIVLIEPHAFGDLLGRAPHADVALAFVLSLLVQLFLWRLFVELTRTIPALRRQRAEAALGRRLIRFARRRQGAQP